mmetsp:Transcript_12208/g.29086  ORF Transcript_12208/g.29086 Transcript_12208/m.29086 type:complete len:331 (+) Transcript_12208:890-1882(+)
MLSSRRLLTQRAASRRCIERTTKRIKSTTTSAENATSTVHQTADRPTNKQLWRVFSHAAVPMIGFGFTDQTVMLQAGNAIDCTLGVTFGLSTLTAAAFGQIISDASGVMFGGTVERAAKMAGLPSANLTVAQRALPIVGRARLMGNLFGVVFGCVLGLVNLLFIDTTRSSSLKLQAFNEGQQFEFEIEASNSIRPDATVLKVQGPDVDGVLASMTAALSASGCSIVEIQAKQENGTDGGENKFTDVFSVINKHTGEQFDDDDLEKLAQDLLDSTRTPMNVNSVKAAMTELQTLNAYLKARVKKLEGIIHDKQITLVSSNGDARHPSPPTD